jgi:hypothetical protein
VGSDSQPFNRIRDRLPGAEIVERGLRDLEQGIESVESLLVSIGAPRLRSSGIEVANPFPDPNLRLYFMLQRSFGDAAHSRYNALIRRLVSYERALCVK